MWNCITMIWTYLIWVLQRGQLGCAHGVTVWFLWAVAGCWLTQGLAEVLGLLHKTWGPLFQHLLAEAQLSRQVGDVADGEAQRIDLGQGLSGWCHWGRQVRPEVLQGLGQIPHPQLLSLAGCLALLPRIPGSGFLCGGGDWIGGSWAGQSLCLVGKTSCCRAFKDKTVQNVLFISGSLEGGRGKAEGVHRRGGRQAAASAEVTRVQGWIIGKRIIGFVQQGLTVKQERVVLELERRAVGHLHSCSCCSRSCSRCCGCKLFPEQWVVSVLLLRQAEDSEEDQGGCSIYEVGGARLHLQQPPLVLRSSGSRADT